jgi:predicted nucleotidyltransferase
MTTSPLSPSSLLAADPLLARLVDDLAARHGCHTIVLYGSRALGTATAESDYDLLGVRAEGEATRDAQIVDGFFLDAFVYPEKDLDDKGPTLLQLRGGVVLREERGIGTRLLSTVSSALAAPPAPLSEAEARMRRVWCQKMVVRIRRGGPEDVEAHHRRAQLLSEAIEILFELRGRRYLGPKESLRWLRENDPQTHRIFAEALAPGAPVEALERMVERVLEGAEGVGGGRP